MQITITIADEQWEEFQEVAQQAVEQSWDGKYEDFASYIMSVNLTTYIQAQQKKQEKKLKRALLALEEQQEIKASPVLTEKPQTVLIAPKKPETAQLAKKAAVPPPVKQEKGMSPKEQAERIAQLEGVPVKRRTLAEAQELQELLITHKKQVMKKK